MPTDKHSLSSLDKFPPNHLRQIAIISFGISGIILFYHVEHFQLIIDDTFICLRYAGNWLAGHGLVFNPGERVEGYTNLLWVLMLAGSIKVGVNGVVAAHYLGIFFGLGALFLVAQFSRFTTGRPRASDALAALMLAMNGAFAVYIGAGLESGLFVFLALLGEVLFLRKIDDPSARRGLWWGFVFVLAYFARPDGGLFFATAFMLRLLVPRECGARLRWKEAIAAGLVFSVPVAIHMLWRLHYYGDWLPNTFYAKAGMSFARLKWGFKYVWGFFKDYTLLPPAMVVFLFALRRRVLNEFIIFVFGVVYLLYVISIGGDRIFPYYRFLLVFFPNLYLLAGQGFEAVWETISKRTSTVHAAAALGLYLTVLLAVSIHFSFTGPEYSVVKGNNEMLEDGIKIGTWLRKNFPPDTWIAVNLAGSIPYYSGLPTVDMLGINDRHIARTRSSGLEYMPGHNKHDFRYVLDRKPAIIIYWERLFKKPPTTLGFHRVRPGFMGFQELFDPQVRARFEREYTFQIARIDGGYFAFFLRKDFLKKFFNRPTKEKSRHKKTSITHSPQEGRESP